jgi:hypothetical protein
MCRMLAPFFALAVLSPRRQRGLRWAVAAHLGVYAGCAWWACYLPKAMAPIVAYVLLTAGIVEGAALLGWRLTQLPKSQALEFLLVTPLRPRRFFLAEALVGLARLALITLSGLPVLTLFVFIGYLEFIDLVPLLLMPFTWGAITGLGLTAWAYESRTVRRWGERVMLVLIVIYLTVGVLAGEHLGQWLQWLPGGLGQVLLDSLYAFHHYNPFAILRFWLDADFAITWQPTLAVEIIALATLGLLLVRTAGRLQGHFHDLHYLPIEDRHQGLRSSPGEQPLSWWAVRRVTQYSGRVNLWLAGGFGVLYALYTVAGASWPSWMGRQVFVVFDQAGGVPVWAAALVVLAAVPAAFQYGLWDSNTHERCRRLELLLLTRLTAVDYWRAAALAAWRRGRGYFCVAVLLWAAAVLRGAIGVEQGLAALATGIILWGLYFALGFRAFSRGMEANLLGLALTLGLPGLAFVFRQFGWPTLAALVPPGSLYYAAGFAPSLAWVLGGILSALAALLVARLALVQCDGELRRWYDQHHGQKVLD